MIKLESSGAKEWNILLDGEKKVNLPLSTSSITNKFYIIKNFVEGASKTLGKPFDNWLVSFLKASLNETHLKKAKLLLSD